MVKDALGEVESVRLAKSGMMLISWLSKEESEKALWLCKLLTHEVASYDYRSRAPIKGVISGFSVDIEASWFKMNMPGIVDSHCLTRNLNGKKEENLDEEFLQTHIKLGYMRCAV